MPLPIELCGYFCYHKKVIKIEEIEKLAELARISLTEDEKAGLQKDIDGVLLYVGQIKNLKAEMADVSPVTENVMRTDEVLNASGEYTEKLINAAPKSENGFVKVKKIL